MEQEKSVYVDDKTVSKMLGIGRQTLVNWRAQQRGPRYVQAGRRAIRYEVNDVLSFMESRKIGTEDQPKDQR